MDDVVGRALVAVDAFDDLIHNASLVPLSLSLRVKRDDLDAAVTELVEAVQAAHLERGATTSVWLAGQIRELAAQAPPVRFVGGARIEAEPFYELLDRLRESLRSEERRVGKE